MMKWITRVKCLALACFITLALEYAVLQCSLLEKMPIYVSNIFIALPPKKYYVGCNPSGWKQYVLREYYYLFTSLEADYGWEELVVLGDKDYQYLLKDPPKVIMFCENFIATLNRLPFKELQQKKTQLAIYIDDMHFVNGIPEENMKIMLDQLDVVINPYAYRFKSYFSNLDLSSVKFPKPLWIPHSASPIFAAGSFNSEPYRQILLSGSIGLKAYPIREWLKFQFQPKNRAVMEQYQHPGYRKVGNNQTMVYANAIRSYFCGITTTSLYRYLIAKVFEIPATGALLLVNNDLNPLMESLGLFKGKHYVSYGNNDPADKIWWVLDEKNKAEIDSIRLAGMHYIREHHMTENRAKALDEYFTIGIEAYPYAELNATTPCPMKGFRRKATCIAQFNVSARFYHHTKPKNQPWPLRPENQPNYKDDDVLFRQLI